MLLLLDTHVWVWSAEGDTRRIGRRARQMLARAEAKDGIRLSPVSIFELTALHTLGRIHLTLPPEQWIEESIAKGVRVADLSPAIAIDAGAFPRASLADPLDRLLVATARQLGAVFLTGDVRILDYASTHGAVRVQNAGV